MMCIRYASTLLPVMTPNQVTFGLTTNAAYITGTSHLTGSSPLLHLGNEMGEVSVVFKKRYSIKT